jgi:hypothetical protein
MLGLALATSIWTIATTPNNTHSNNNKSRIGEDPICQEKFIPKTATSNSKIADRGDRLVGTKSRSIRDVVLYCLKVTAAYIGDIEQSINGKEEI